MIRAMEEIVFQTESSRSKIIVLELKRAVHPTISFLPDYVKVVDFIQTGLIVN